MDKSSQHSLALILGLGHKRKVLGDLFSTREQKLTLINTQTRGVRECYHRLEESYQHFPSASRRNRVPDGIVGLSSLLLREVLPEVMQGPAFGPNFCTMMGCMSLLLYRHHYPVRNGGEIKMITSPRTKSIGMRLLVV